MTRVVALGALCGNASYESLHRSAHVVVAECAVLSDGRRLTLHRERGTSWGARSASGEVLDPWESVTLASLRQTALNCVLPDEDDGEDHPWVWLVGLLEKQGVETTPARLRQVPYVVEFDDSVRERLSPRDG